MKFKHKYTTYNQIIKEFEVYIVKSTNNKYKLELVRKPDGPRPPKPPRETKPPKWFSDYMDKFRKEINDRFDNLIKKNNLVE